jgi:hypothetical protein
MPYEDCLAHVLQEVLARDLPDEAFGPALADQAGLLSGESPDGD